MTIQKLRDSLLSQNVVRETFYKQTQPNFYTAKKKCCLKLSNKTGCTSISAYKLKWWDAIRYKKVKILYTLKMLGCQKLTKPVVGLN